jgi:hypothetical protein
LKDLSPIFIVSAIAVFAGYFGSSLLGWSLYPDGIVKALIFIAVYLGWSLLFKPEAYKYTLTVLDTLKSKRKRKKHE